jgi:hypothetical protein
MARLYKLYLNGRFYKTYDKIGPLKCAIRLKNSIPGGFMTVKIIEYEETELSEINADSIMPEKCLICGRFSPSALAAQDDKYWHRYDCSERTGR